MRRRSFLQTLLGVVVAPLLAPALKPVRPALTLNPLQVPIQRAIHDAQLCRVDILYGWKAIRPELACRLIA